MKNAYAVLGFARRAGKVTLGYDAICRLKVKQYLVLLASDAAERTKKHVLALKQETLELPLTKGELGHLLGVKEVSAAAVTDPGFAEGIRKQLNTL